MVVAIPCATLGKGPVGGFASTRGHMRANILFLFDGGARLWVHASCLDASVTCGGLIGCRKCGQELGVFHPMQVPHVYDTHRCATTYTNCRHVHIGCLVVCLANHCPTPMFPFCLYVILTSGYRVLQNVIIDGHFWLPCMPYYCVTISFGLSLGGNLCYLHMYLCLYFGLAWNLLEIVWD